VGSLAIGVVGLLLGIIGATQNAAEINVVRARGLWPAASPRRCSTPTSACHHFWQSTHQAIDNKEG
jgi:hypothetical protein